jgi:hypothetical protein
MINQLWCCMSAPFVAPFVGRRPGLRPSLARGAVLSLSTIVMLNDETADSRD